MRIVFMGTPEFAAESLGAVLASRHAVAAVLTQPDRPRGRHRRREPPPVKALAQQHGVPVLQPESVNRRAVREQVFALEPDLIVVAAFGHLLHEEYLARPRRGAINVHASLLPRHRGAAPIQAAILAGETLTGVSIQRMVKDMDAGAVLRKLSTQIGERETASQLEGRLAKLGAEALVLTLDELEDNRAHEQPQDHSQATYARKLSKRDGLIDWRLPAEYLGRFVRAMTDWPGAFTFWAGPGRGPLRLTILEAQACELPPTADTCPPQPGAIVEAGGSRIAVAAGSGALRIARLQLEGKGPRTAADFLRGQAMQPGQSLGTY